MQDLFEALNLALTILEQSEGNEDKISIIKQGIESLQNPVFYECRGHYGEYSAIPGWMDWEPIVGSNPIYTAEHKLRDIKRYIQSGNKYQIGALYALPLDIKTETEYNESSKQQEFDYET